MMQITILLEPSAALFYTNISKAAGIPLEQVLSDALFKLAGELSLEALRSGEAMYGADKNNFSKPL